MWKKENLAEGNRDVEILMKKGYLGISLKRKETKRTGVMYGVNWELVSLGWLSRICMFPSLKEQ